MAEGADSASVHDRPTAVHGLSCHIGCHPAVCHVPDGDRRPDGDARRPQIELPAHALRLVTGRVRVDASRAHVRLVPRLLLVLEGRSVGLILRPRTPSSRRSSHRCPSTPCPPCRPGYGDSTRRRQRRRSRLLLGQRVQDLVPACPHRPGIPGRFPPSRWLEPDREHQGPSRSRRSPPRPQPTALDRRSPECLGKSTPITQSLSIHLPF